jgi:hypothetical protein
MGQGAGRSALSHRSEAQLDDADSRNVPRMPVMGFLGLLTWDSGFPRHEEDALIPKEQIESAGD